METMQVLFALLSAALTLGPFLERSVVVVMRCVVVPGAIEAEKKPPLVVMSCWMCAAWA